MATLDHGMLLKRDAHVAPASVLTNKEPCCCAMSAVRPSAEMALDFQDRAFVPPSNVATNSERETVGSIDL